MRSSSLVLGLIVALSGACGGGGGGGGDGGGDDGPVEVHLTVSTAMDRTPISPLIYGINQNVDPDGDKPTVVRSGGNRLTAYNWENNASNAGTDYCNQNDATFGNGGAPANAFRDMLDDARARDTAAIVTASLVDDVAADHDDLGDQGQGPPACVGDVQNSGGGYLASRFAKNHARKGAAFADPPNLGDDAVYQDEMIAYVKSHWGDVNVLVSLDNEPDLWASTHPRIRPSALTYADLVARNIEYADALKDAFASVQTLGFVSFGFSGYVNLQSAPDAAGREFLSFYLDSMKTAETTTGHRLVDYLDLHWYPEAQGGGTRITSVSDGTAAQARVQAPRSLWDPSYRETSWIADDFFDGPVALLPWIEERIDAHYPGTKLAISEWNYGGGDHISGAIATADALGVFGREGVDLATIWLLSGQEPFTRAGLRTFTNFDGAGGAFGGTSVRATTDDVARVTIYASERANGDVVLVLINKATSNVVTEVTVTDETVFAHAERYVLTGSSPSFAPGARVHAEAGNSFVLTLPGSSITVLVPGT